MLAARGEGMSCSEFFTRDCDGSKAAAGEKMKTHYNGLDADKREAGFTVVVIRLHSSQRSDIPIVS
jgi:hypothetical protein